MKNHGVELTHVANEVSIGPSINFGPPDLRGHKNVATLLLHIVGAIAGARRRDENRCPFSHEHGVRGGDSWSSSREGSLSLSLSRGAAVSFSLCLSCLSRRSHEHAFHQTGILSVSVRRDATSLVVLLRLSSFDRIPLVALKRNATCDAFSRGCDRSEKRVF